MGATEILTPELKAYAARVVARMGLKELTPETLGEVLQIAINDMDKAVCRYREKKATQSDFVKHVYVSIRAAK